MQNFVLFWAFDLFSPGREGEGAVGGGEGGVFKVHHILTLPNSIRVHLTVPVVCLVSRLDIFRETMSVKDV